MQQTKSEKATSTVTVLIIGDRKLYEPLFVGDEGSKDFSFVYAASAEDAKRILNREGYRFRVVVSESDLLTGSPMGGGFWIPTMTRSCPWTLFVVATSPQEASKKAASSAAPGIGNIVHWYANESSRASDLPEFLRSERDFLEQLPNPPFHEANEIGLLREAGPLLFTLCSTEAPWKLETDAIVVPVSQTGHLGALGKSWNTHWETTPTLESVALDTTRGKKLTPASPIAATASYSAEGETHSHRVFFATAKARRESVENAVTACLASIALASKTPGIETLVLPLIGSEEGSLDPKPVLVGLLEGFSPHMELGDLKHVLIPVDSPETFERLREAEPPELMRPKELENDLPGGEDRLGVKTDIIALADSIALRDLEPPLVVGILGGWGTGKSFALHLLEKRLAEIRCWDLRDKQIRDEFPFVGHVYLVRFDAWTYAKQDLWASLMHKILFDLNQQLGLEEAAADHLLYGLDIWSLIRGLTKEEFQWMKTDLGPAALARLNHWESEDTLTTELWRALNKERAEESFLLEQARKALEEAERDFDAERARNRSTIETADREAEAKTADAIEKETKEIEDQLRKERDTLDQLESNIQKEVDRKFETQAKNAAWNPALDRLRSAFGTEIEKALPDGVKEAPASFVGLYDSLKRWHRYLKGLSPQHIAFLIAGLCAVPLAGFVVSQLTNHPGWTTFGAVTTAIAGFASSLKASSDKALAKLEKEQTAYEADLRKREAELREKRDQELASRRSVETKVQLAKVAEKTAELDKERSRIRAEQNAELEKQRLELEAEFEIRTREHEEHMKDLSAEVEERERLVGMTAISKSLAEVVSDRIASGDYDKHLGVVHRVQNDLAQISDALLPRDYRDEKLFPRGDPRIVLVIDDLDRCTPDQVVQVLEAAQLLVRTRLFVVVIAMDVRYVSRSLEKEYVDVLIPDGTPSGLDYIEKIIQIPYRVPDIAPEAMRPFLSAQMHEATSEVESPPPDEDKPEDAPVEREKIVFYSSRTAEDEAKIPPKRVIEFATEEVNLLDACCSAAEVSPRSAKRLVNVFKLLKIIWHHRGPGNEPEDRVKHGMMFLLALSARQPVVMREVLRDLHAYLLRKENAAKALTTIIAERIQVHGIPDNTAASAHLVDVVKNSELRPKGVTLRDVGLDNLRLVRSFSFVGETVEEFGIQTERTDGPSTSTSDATVRGSASRS